MAAATIDSTNMNNLFSRQELIDIARGRSNEPDKEVTHPDGSITYIVHSKDGAHEVPADTYKAMQKWCHK